MSFENYYGIRNLESITLYDGGDIVKIETMNYGNIVRVENDCALVFDMQVVNDDTIKSIERLDSSLVTLTLNAKDYNTGEYSKKEIELRDMSFAKSIKYNSQEPSSMVFVLTNCPYKDIRKEVNKVLDEDRAIRILEEFKSLFNVGEAVLDKIKHEAIKEKQKE